MNDQSLTLTDQIEGLYYTVKDTEPKYRELMHNTHPNFIYSARNLIHYLTLRTYDLRKIQKELSELGLSSISSPEGYTLINLERILEWLYLKEGEGRSLTENNQSITYKKSRKMIKKNVKRLFGKISKSKPAHIMVTMPEEAAADYELVKSMIEKGMDIARINLGHESIESWEKMVKNIRKANEELNSRCRIYFDLAGPKIRTSFIEVNGEKPDKFRTIKEGDKVILAKKSKVKNLDGESSKHIPLKISLPSIIDDLNVGDEAWFDDGKIGGVVTETNEETAIVEINKAKKDGSKLKKSKGINFPNTSLTLPSLTDYDIENLDFVAEHADIIGFSFVRSKEDVNALIEELSKRNALDKGLVLKIETNEAFFNLPEMILAAMKLPSVGVMIARGDLAVEVGFERISEVQEEILWLCEAAHIPVIWATQVLENLAKKGRATRSEISDVSLAIRADCIMLNKGPHILEAIKSLSNIMMRMSHHQVKKKSKLRPLHVAERFFDIYQPEMHTSD